MEGNIEKPRGEHPTFTLLWKALERSQSEVIQTKWLTLWQGHKKIRVSSLFLIQFYDQSPSLFETYKENIKIGKIISSRQCCWSQSLSTGLSRSAATSCVVELSPAISLFLLSLTRTDSTWVKPATTFTMRSMLRKISRRLLSKFRHCSKGNEFFCG